MEDGSTDNSLKICEYFEGKDSRIRLVKQINSGLSFSRQKGITLAKGKYICTVDSDDYVNDKFIEFLYKSISESNSDIAICELEVFKDDSKNKKKITFSNDTKDIIKVSKHTLETEYVSLLRKYYMSDSWNKIYSKKFLSDSSVSFNLSKEFNGTDLLFNHQLLLHEPKISIVRKSLYHYRIRKNSRVRRKNKQLQKGFFEISDKILKEMNKNKLKNIDSEFAKLYLSFQPVILQDIFSNSGSFKEFKKKIKLYFESNKRFIVKNNINNNFMNTETKNMKFLYVLIKYEIVILLYYYFKKRKIYED